MPEHCSLLILSYCTATNTIVKLRPLPVADASSSCFYRLAEEGEGRGGRQEGDTPSIALLTIILLIDNP